MRKILSVVISLVMAFSIVSYAVFADEDEKVPEVVAPDGFPEDAVQLPKDDLEVVSEKEKFIPADLTPEMFRQIFGALETQESIQIYIDKEIVIFPDVKPQIIDGRTLVPVRFIAEQLGAKVDYESVNGKEIVTVSTRNLTIELTVGEKLAKVNGIDYYLDVPAMIIEDRTMVPFRFIFERFGMDVAYQEMENAEGETVALIFANTGK